MGTILDGLISAPIPGVVWHYTKLAGFIGMISSGGIWATEAHFTTDEHEFVHARQIAERILRERVYDSRADRRGKQIAREALAHDFDQGYLSSSKVEVFVASFCATEDLPSQWENYGDGGHGVSLGFNLSHARPATSSDLLVTFAPCLYGISEKERLIEDALASFTVTVIDMHRKTRPGANWIQREIKGRCARGGSVVNPSGFMDEFHAYLRDRLGKSRLKTVANLLRAAAHCKDTKYQPEAEWRLALPHEKGKPMFAEILYRERDGKQVPYLNHDFGGGRLPLVEVKVGPSMSDMRQIEALLRDHGYDVPVTKSSAQVNG